MLELIPLQFLIFCTISLTGYAVSSVRSNFFATFVLYLPGVFMHELSHFIMSLITNGRPVKVSLIPKRTSEGVTLGYVVSSNVTWYNAFLISYAPLLLVPFSYWLFMTSFEFGVLLQLLLVSLATVVLFSSAPSSSDHKVAFSQPVGFLLFFGVISFFVFLFLQNA